MQHGVARVRVLTWPVAMVTRPSSQFCNALYSIYRKPNKNICPANYVQSAKEGADDLFALAARRQHGRAIVQ